jgi:hypothetical protein
MHSTQNGIIPSPLDNPHDAVIFGRRLKLIVEVIEPYQGAIFDPACGSGGMSATPESLSFWINPLTTSDVSVDVAPKVQGKLTKRAIF